MKTKLLAFLLGLLAFSLPGEVVWSGYKGAATAEPQVTTRQDPQKGSVTRIEAQADGRFQGAVTLFKPEVDLTGIEAVEFDVRQNITGAKCGLIMRFEQATGWFYGTAVVVGKEWAKVRLKLDGPNDFTTHDGQAAVMGKASELRIYPYSDMDTQGEFLEIANFRLIAKGNAAAPVVKAAPAPAPAAPVAVNNPQAAKNITWGGYKGGAKMEPKVTTRQDAQKGLVTRIETVADGEFQGASAFFKPESDISDAAAVEFEIRHNIHQGKCGFVLRFEQAKGWFYGAAVTPVTDWHKIRMAFDLQNFTPQNGNTVVFDKVKELRLYPYGAMNKAGMFIEIANFRFVPKAEVAGSQPIKVMSYSYINKPTSGDDNCTILIDGDNSKNSFYRQFSVEPDIVFDLGGRYALDSMDVEAFAPPSHNFSEIAVQSSFDQKTWIPGGVLKNNQSGTEARLAKYTFKPGERPIVGRYIRLRASRPRSDFSVYLSEVKFIGHVPSEEELAAAAESNYDTGKAMPERNSKNYYVLKNNDWKLYISKTNGVVNGAYYKDKLLVERFTPKYTLQSRAKDTEIDGFYDTVKNAKVNSDSVTVTVTNDKLPGLEIERTWYFENDGLMEKVAVVNKNQRERLFLRLATEVIFEQQFRKNGFYEMPSSALASGMFRIPTAEVQMDRAMTNIPTLAIENNIAKQTVWHTRYRFNDRFTYYNVGTEEDNLQVFRANGWLLTAATIVPADAVRQSFENRFSVTDGRMLQAYDEYLSLPEVAEFRGQIVRPKWMRDLRAGMAFGWDGNYPESSKRLMSNWKNTFSHRGSLYDCELIDMDGIWGDLPISGPVRGSFGEVRDATEIRQRIRDIKAFDPRFKIGIYSWFWSAFPWSTPVKNHPEWFVSKLRNGAPASWFPGVNTNYLRFWGIPESRQEALDQIVKFINYYEQDSWYVDGGKCGVYAKDWETMRIDDPLGQTDFYLAVRNAIRKDHPERAVAFNHSENPIGDYGFLESFGGTLTNEWRRGAVLMWKFKMYHYKDPWHLSAYNYWLPGVDGAFQNYMSGVGVVGDFCGRDLKFNDVPYVGARYDIRTAQLRDADVQPDWRFDWNEELELMALQQQNNGWIFMHYHGDKPVTREISADAAALGISDKSKPVYCWNYTIRYSKDYAGIFSEPQLNKSYADSTWVSDRGVIPEYLGKKAWSERVTGNISFNPLQAKILMFSQVPAVVLSIENDPVHYYLAGQPGVEVSGDKAKLTVSNEYKEAEIGMILDDNEEPAVIKVNGSEVPFRVRTDRNFRCAVFKVGSGDSVAEVSYKTAEPVVTTALEANVSGKTLTVTVAPENAPVQIYFEDVLTLSKVGSFTMELPETAKDGVYEVVSGGKSCQVAVKGAAKLLKHLPILVTLPVDYKQEAVGKNIRGIDVINQAHSFSIGAGEVKIDADNLTLKAGTLPYYESHYNEASAALEMKVKSYLKLRITNGVIHHTRYAYEPQVHFVRGHVPGAMAGLMIDFGSENGYKVRVAAGFGHQHEARKAPNFDRPVQWGTKGAASRVFELKDLMRTTEIEKFDCWVDLASLGAPADWDGRIWFAVHQEHMSPDRSFTVEILETADKLPAGVQALVPMELGAKYEKETHNIGRLNGKVEASSLPVLMEKLYLDRGAEDLTTTVRAAYDDENLYFFYDCRETADHIMTCPGGSKGKPWEGDSVEFFVQRTDAADETLHAVIDGEGYVYAENAPFRSGPGKKNVVLGEIPFKYQIITDNKPHWQAFVTVPWSALGGKPAAGTKLGFNLMRTRNEQGRHSFYTLSNDRQFLSADQCQMQLQ